MGVSQGALVCGAALAKGPESSKVDRTDIDVAPDNGTVHVLESHSQSSIKNKIREAMDDSRALLLDFNADLGCLRHLVSFWLRRRTSSLYRECCPVIHSVFAAWLAGLWPALASVR